LLDQEEQDAHDFVSKFVHMNLDPNSIGDNDMDTNAIDDNTMDTGPVQPWPANNEVHEGGILSYEKFQFMDNRSEDEKWDRRRKRQRHSQVQLYFYMRYYYKKVEKPGCDLGGFSGLVYRSQADGGREAAFKYAPLREVEHMFDMWKFMIPLTGQQREDFVRIMNRDRDLFAGDASNGNGLEVHFPTNKNDVRKRLFEGSNSIMTNFPVPKVSDINNHACADLKETILLAAGHGAKFNFAWDPTRPAGALRNTDGLNGTKAVRDLLKDIIEAQKRDGHDDEVVKATSMGWIYFWSDSFLRCFVKQKENSVWILTVTICPPESEKSSGAYTHILAMGKSGEDHTPVIEHYLKEYTKLMKGFDCYFGESNDVRRMAVGMLCWNADRPERQMIGETRKEGDFGKVTGYAVKVDEDLFPACHACYRSLVRTMIGADEEGSDTGHPPACTGEKNCFNWTLDPNAEEQRTVRPREGYPKCSDKDDHLNQPEGRKAGMALLGPVKHTAKFMATALQSAYEGLRLKIWSRKGAQTFLEECNVKDSRVGIVLDKAEADRAEGHISSPDEYEPMALSHVDLYSRFRLPDLPMHGLGHGIITDVMDYVMQILAHHNKRQAFIEFANERLEDIGSLHLDYCKVKVLPKAAWVAENKFAFARLFPYICGCFLSITPLTSSQDAHARETVANLKRLLNALSAMISVLMSRSDTPLDKTTINNHMKVFMSSAHFLHKRYGKFERREGKQKNAKKKDAVDRLIVNQLKDILKAFDVTPVPSLKEDMLAKVKAVTVDELKAFCEQWDVDLEGLSKKSEIQEKLLGHILNEDLSKENAKKESMCWNKGNWLSFTTNIADQIDYLGMLHLIW